MRAQRGWNGLLRRLRALPPAAALALALALAATACGPGRVLSPEEIKDHGTVTLRTPAAKAYRAAHEALKSLGYEVEEETPDKGLIVTKRRPIPDLSLASTTGAMFSRRYTLEIKDFGGMCRITATPAMFENDKDISSKRIWDLEGALGEHELWKQLFAKIEQLL